MKAETDSGERPEVNDGPRNVVGIGDGATLREAAERLLDGLSQLREQVKELEQENKALKVDFAWLDDHVVRVCDKDDKLIFFRAPGASPTRTYIAEARSAGESPNAS